MSTIRSEFVIRAYVVTGKDPKGASVEIMRRVSQEEKTPYAIYSFMQPNGNEIGIICTTRGVTEEDKLDFNKVAGCVARHGEGRSFAVRNNPSNLPAYATIET